MVHPTRKASAFDVRPADPLSVLTVQIAETVGVLPEQQRLLFKGQQLTPCFSFDEYHIHCGARVHLVLELTGRSLRDALLPTYPLNSESSENELRQGENQI